MSRERPRCQYVDEDGRVCGLLKAAAPHVGYGEGTHDYEPPAREGFGAQRAPIRARSERPNRVQRREEVVEARRAAHAGPRHCVAPEHGIQTPCGTGVEATLEASHVIGLGMGGGKEYGEVVLLCRKHHRELDTDRPTFRAAGLSKRAPSSQAPRSMFR